jgi:hypothetical protein
MGVAVCPLFIRNTFASSGYNGQRGIGVQFWYTYVLPYIVSIVFPMGRIFCLKKFTSVFRSFRQTATELPLSEGVCVRTLAVQRILFFVSFLLLSRGFGGPCFSAFCRLLLACASLAMPWGAALALALSLVYQAVDDQPETERLNFKLGLEIIT